MFGKKRSILLTVLIALTMLVACNNTQSSSSNNQDTSEDQGSSKDNGDTSFEKISLNFSHGSQVGEPTHIAALEFSENIEKRTNGAVKVNVYPASQLGSERDVLEQVKGKSVHFAISSPGMLGSFEPRIGIFNAPFLWNSWEDAVKVMSGPIGQEIYTSLAEKESLKVLDPSWYWGYRHITANKEITHPDDMEGLKIRVPNIPVFVEMAKSMGASPTPIDFGELYTAVQQGVVDAQENPIPTILSANIYEVQSHVILSSHMLQSNLLVTNSDWFKSLSKELQDIISEEIIAAGKLATEEQMKAEIENLEMIKAAGVTVIEPDQIDMEAFQEVSKVVYDQFTDEWGSDLYEQIIKAQE